ncbi:hypothetical protein [Vibrio algivorus]|uniref:Uncharacterized protein n=1 Tax=Vibrio algivorus TaxID=1667024 RepID=A0A557P9Q5_9VIBR|nr:hypothetical protein [Vibrio algivorus]TVO37379.1 hypothetical protein FOF44_07155 [Vibrio algivorus]
MNNLHDYPPDWDKPEIIDSPVFRGLLSNNVEALFDQRGVNDDFMVALSKVQPNDLGCDLLTALVLFLKGVNTERRTFDFEYARELYDGLKVLKLEMGSIAQEYVLESTKQDFSELQRHD